AVLRHIALTRGGTADRAARQEDVHARGIEPRAVIGPIARAALGGARAARHRGRGRVRWAGARRARTSLRGVALTRGGTADRAAREEGIQARAARRRAVIRPVARPA